MTLNPNQPTDQVLVSALPSYIRACRSAINALHALPSNVFDVENGDYGFVNDGVAINTEPIQDAIDDAEEYGGTVILPLGNILIDDELVISHPGVTIQGSGGFYGTALAGTRLQQTSLTKDVIKVTSEDRDVEEVNIFDLHLRGMRATGTSGHGLHLLGSGHTLSRVNVQRVYVTECKQAGFYLDSSVAWGALWFATMRDCGAFYNGTNGVLIDAVVESVFENLYLNANYNDGLKVKCTQAGKFSSALSFNRVSAEYTPSPYWAMNFEKLLWSRLMNLWFEVNTRNLKITSCQGLKIFIETMGVTGVQQAIGFGADVAGCFNADIEIDAPGLINSGANETIELTAPVTFVDPGLILGCKADAGGSYATPFVPADIENFATYDDYIHFKYGTPSGTLGFYGKLPTTCQVLATATGKTVDNVITALQTLGLVKQA